jgi:hypothetical protein
MMTPGRVPASSFTVPETVWECTTALAKSKAVVAINEYRLLMDFVWFVLVILFGKRPQT